MLESLQLKSFNESLNAQPLCIPTSTYPLKRDGDIEEPYYRGCSLLCQLESLDLPLQSTITTTAQLDASGWSRIRHDPLERVHEVLQPAFDELGIVYDPRDEQEITWNHDRESQNANHQIAPVCFYRLY